MSPNGSTADAAIPVKTRLIIMRNSLLIPAGAPAHQNAGALAGLVAMARGKTPDPIPNSAVKTLSADGTAP
jgi:hypothetical protein